MHSHPVIGVTLGDPGGIGPEIILKSLQSRSSAKIVVFGSKKVLLHHSSVLQLPFPDVDLVDIDNVLDPYFGPRPQIAGAASIEYLERAFHFYHQGKIQAIVTCPIHKESWHLSGYHYPGQTEYCAAKTQTSEFCMLMAGKHFRIALLSTHLSLQEALALIRQAEIEKKLRLLDREFRKLGFDHPKIGCAALNPHASEAGAFGDEEMKQIIPAIEAVRKENIFVDGPIAPEVIFRVASAQQKWVVLLALYHDQAMIPLKLIDFEHSANVTLGLPLIRTSPDHGTAFDIAGKGIAHAGSMHYAIDLAIEWTNRRNTLQ